MTSPAPAANAPVQSVDPATAAPAPAPTQAAPAPSAAPAPTSPDAAPTTAQAQPAPTNSSAAVQTAVNTGFGKYDADGDGNLTEAEFKTWIAALKTDEMKATGQSVNAAEVTAYANAAFASADADKDQKVSKAEVTGFLGG
ncbi:EF-hand domain-containing protein [Sphingobium sp. CR28]|uniref:EF-hand domain-containing protein n=1 Tax=Sphingobium sp. CR28 TaxID=3400272 RepID=UPI003FEFDD5F